MRRSAVFLAGFLQERQQECGQAKSAEQEKREQQTLELCSLKWDGGSGVVEVEAVRIDWFLEVTRDRLWVDELYVRVEATQQTAALVETAITARRSVLELTATVSPGWRARAASGA